MTVTDTGLASHRPHHPGMDRRRFLLTSLAGAFAAPLDVRAQRTEKVYRIGYLGNAPWPDAFRRPSVFSAPPFPAAAALARRLGQALTPYGGEALPRMRFVTGTGLTRHPCPQFWKLSRRK
jgi:hypothetical protein